MDAVLEIIHGEPRLAAVKPPLPPCNAADTQFKQLSFAQIVDSPDCQATSPHSPWGGQGAQPSEKP